MAYRNAPPAEDTPAPVPPDDARGATPAEPGTSMTAAEAPAPKEEDFGSMGDLPPAALERLAIMRATLKERLFVEKQARFYAAASSKITWARNLSPDQLTQLAGWARQGDLDLLTEFYILGGSAPYVNAKWYIRQLGALVALGEIAYAYYEVVSKDERLEAEVTRLNAEVDVLSLKASDAKDDVIAEKYRSAAAETADEAFTLHRLIRERAKARMEHGLPDEALAAVVWHVKSRRMEQEVTAAQAVGGYRGKNESGKFKDPVGEEFPRETAITRGARKAMLSLAHVAPVLERKEREAREAAAKVAELLPAMDAAGREELRRLYAINPIVNSDDPYTPAPNSEARSG